MMTEQHKFTTVAVKRLALTAIAGAVLAMSAPAGADDTEVFFDQSNSASTNPNILFVIPTGSSMGCRPGASTTCQYALEDGTSRMDVVKAALIKTIDRIQEKNIGVNIGLMRGNNNGNDGSNAAKGGMIIQHVSSLTKDNHGTELKKWICPYGSASSACNFVRPNSGNGQQEAFAPSNDADFSKLGSGRQQLTEILFEANRYYGARNEVWASNGGIGPSYSFPGKLYSPSSIWGPATQVPGSCPGNGCVYKTPIATPSCQLNLIVILSDGFFASDTGNDKGAQSISSSAGDPGNKWFKVYQDSYKESPTGPALSLTSGIDSGSGCSRNLINYSGQQLSNCADDLAYSMRNGGFVKGLPGATAFTYTIGFDLANASGGAPAAARDMLKLIARAGGGKYYDVTDAEKLADVFQAIVDEAVIGNASFTSPAVSINSFNRTQNLNELYMSVFKPSSSLRWNGNIKKYRLAPNGDILGIDSSGSEVLAVNSLKGVFLPNVADLWAPSGSATGQQDVLEGGAAANLPEPASRTRIFTNANGANVVSSLDATTIDSLKSNVNAATILGYTAQSLTPPSCPSPETSIANSTNPAICQLVNWIGGADISDVFPAGDVANSIPDGNGITTEGRGEMGDPLHTRPAIVIYGGEPGDTDINDAMVYGLSNDGMLHAIDPQTGVEQWAFIPWDQLQRTLALYQDGASRPRETLGLDGTVRAFKLDNNRDGVVDPDDGDRVYLYFGMRRGGRYIYALDITDKDDPELMWIIGPTGDSSITDTDRQLPNLGYTWSRPVVTRMTVPGHSNPDNPGQYVLLFGGGYDPTKEDVAVPQAYVDATMGMGIFMVDAESGELLWRAGPDGGAKLQLSSMTKAIPSDLAVLDLTGDGFVDLVYTGDLGGKVWRFEFNQAANSVANMVTGGVFADLGGSGAQNARRFFSAPDVSFVSAGALSWYNVVIGSGNREMPLKDTITDDRLYSLRDQNKLIPYTWGSTPALTEIDLVNVNPGAVTATDTNALGQNSVPPSADGWFIKLESFDGEKMISPSRTFDNTVFAPSFVPQKRSEDTDGNACTDAVGYNNLYQVSVFDGRPSDKYLDATTHASAAGGLAIRLEQFGIAPETVFLFPGAEGDSEDAVRPPPVCLIGTESCGQFTGFEPKRTFWLQKSAQ